MSTSQVLDRAFSLYRQNFILFAGIAALPPAMLLVVQAFALFFGLASPRVTGLNTTAMIAALVVFGIGFFLLYLLGYSLATGATIYAVSQVHLGKTSTIGETYGNIRRFTGKILLIVILLFIIFIVTFMLSYLAGIVPLVIAAMIGSIAGSVVKIVAFVLGTLALIACVIAGMLFYCRFGLSIPACVLEKLGPINSIQRSWSLAKGSAARILLIYFLTGVIAIVLSLVLSIPNYIAIGMTAGKPPLPFQIWGIVASFLAGTIAGPIGTIAISLVYYDQRVRKEAFDLQLMMEAMGQPIQPQVAAAASPNIG